MSEIERRIDRLLSDLTDAFAELANENQLLRRRARHSHNSTLGLSRIDHRFKNMFKPAAKPELQRWIANQQLVGHQDGILDISTSAVDTSLATTASVDGTAIIWQLQDSSQWFIFKHGGAVNSARFHPSLMFIVTASGDNTAAVVNVKPGHFQRRVSLSSMRVNNEDDIDSRHSVSPMVARSMSWPNVENLEELDGDGAEEIQNKKRSSSVPSLSKALTISDADCMLNGHEAPVTAADWVFDGTQIATASWDGQCLIWDIGDSSATISRRLKGHSGRICNLSTTATARLVLTSSQDEIVCLWDLRQASQSVSIFRGHTDEVTSAIFSRGHHADMIASSSEDRTVQVWDIRMVKKPLIEIACGSRVNRLCFSPNGSLLTLPGDDGSLNTYNLSGELVIKGGLTGRGGTDMVTCATWASDSAQLLSAGWDCNVTSWVTSEQVPAPS
uniref:Uncharacterized protein n=1 Tax=Spongospora subterranea TaxID=70186 RepID=A0A0H5R7X0_9EUKA|eukprot:CRZ09812.1 hypothetical protein [Spongospora subterranea]